MDALHDQNFALAKLHKFTAVLTLARHEVVIGQFYFFPCDNLLQVLIELLQIQRLHALEVLLAVLIQRGVLPIKEIIVQRNLVRLHAQRAQLNT